MDIEEYNAMKEYLEELAANNDVDIDEWKKENFLKAASLVNNPSLSQKESDELTDGIIDIYRQDG